MQSSLDWPGLFDGLSQTRWQIALVISGGGSGVIKRCFGRSGASKNFVEATVAYSCASMADYLGGAPIGPNASLDTAKQLARVACGRAKRLTDFSGEMAAGIALVAALPTIPPRDHQHQIHVALQLRGSSDLPTERHWSRLIAEQDVQSDVLSARAMAEGLAESLAFSAMASLL